VTRQRFYIVLITALVIFAGAARLYDLRADPPAYFAGGSQDLTTDGAYLTLHARNAVLAGEWNPFGYQHWEEFKISLVSGLAYLVFRLSGVSLLTANLTGVILNLAAVLLFIIALSKYCKPRALFFVFFFLAIDYLLWLFGRLPFSENAVLFLAACVFFVFTFWFERMWGKILIGALVASCGLFGKSYGFLIIAGPLTYIACERESRNWRSVVALLAPICIGLYFYSVLVSGKSGLAAFIWQHAAGEHGYPYGLLSPLHYFEKLISFANNNLFSYAPIPGLLAFLFLTRNLISPTNGQAPQRKPVYFMVGWLVTWLVLVSPFNYLPPRYMYVLLVPICTLAGFELDRIGEWKLRLPAKLAWWRLCGLLLLNWMLMYYIVVYPLINWKPDRNILHLTWLALPLGLACLAVEWLFLKRRTLSIPVSFRKAAITVAVVAALVLNARQYYLWYSARTYGISDAATEISQLLGPSAVLAGQYGPVLACDGRLGGFPLFLSSDPRSFVTLLSRYPVTHLAISETDWDQLTKDDDELRACPIVARYWLRDKIVCVARINDLFGNAQAGRYIKSEYETALDFCNAGVGDSCLNYLERFLRANRFSKTAMVEKYHLTVNSKDLWPSRGIVDSLVSAFPTDMTVRVLASVYYRSLFERTRIAAFQELAEAHMKEALRYSPQNENGIRDACKNAQPEQRIF